MTTRVGDANVANLAAEGNAGPFRVESTRYFTRPSILFFRSRWALGWTTITRVQLDNYILGVGCQGRIHPYRGVIRFAVTQQEAAFVVGRVSTHLVCHTCMSSSI